MGAREFSFAPPSPAADAVREYSFTAQDFDRVRKLIYARAGISLNESKQNMVYSRLSRRLRTLGVASFGHYLDQLESDAAFMAAESQEFVNALTTNLTAFFREPHHFPVLAEFLRRHAGAPGLRLCVLEAARRGVYRLDAARQCGEARLKRFFLRGSGANEGMVRVKPEAQRLVEFEPLNLLESGWSAQRRFAGQLDVVFIRNVMIYFDKPTQRQILERLAAVIRRGGLLFIGHSENFTDQRELFVLRGKTVYERI